MADVTKIETKDGNIYEVDGKRYRELTREPAVGDTALIIDADYTLGKYENGDVLTIDRVCGYGIEVDACSAEDNPEGFIYNREFVIVEPIERETPGPNPYLSEILDGIKTKLTRLEERTEENHRNILTFSQMAESARSDASKAVGGVNALDEQLDLVREDIVLLDEKVSALEKAKPPQNITININVLDIESAKAIVESITKGRE
ncbi:hypothetical protein [Bacillus wiedmannii]|uniref:hypothetical protein n=1 Tax=Bacillus wiedmannii TaxID=1890302 RepID=UPI0007CA7B54|nr:hypothetical protein [Bacillus wiedmannii]OAK36265.1 hypothetical protein A6284_26135 [Bacillus wiedmannii]HDR7641320.1 hypothetical protein [Bacillus wiedmannii]